ncbi:MAG: PD-(D/E)XK nuclease family protein, partial [Clostridia bacterium]|nr:PD-(D/E)XK nuclease family protein [Clostridia bacterium]
MLTLIESGFGAQGREELIKRISRDVALGVSAKLIVPEQQTLMAEKEMCDILPPSAPLCFEATNFTRFADTAFRTLGGISGSYCGKAEQMLVMWQTLKELGGSISLTENRSIGVGVVAKALSAVKELSSRGITPELIEERLDGERVDNRLGRKLQDMTRIMARYNQLLHRRFSDVSDSIGALATKLEEDDAYILGMRIYIDGFTSFTEPQYRLIRTLMRSCDVVVTLTLPKNEREEFVYSELMGCKARLEEIARDNKIEIDTFTPDSPSSDIHPLICQMSRMLWQSGATLDNNYLQMCENDRERVRIFECDNPFDECETVASDIRRRVIEGCSYSDFAIVARNTDAYVGILDTALQRAKIPCFISKRRDIQSLEAIKLINTAYNIILYGFRREDMISYSKCGLSGIRRMDRDSFEIYVNTWGIDKDSFIDKNGWCMSPCGFGEGGSKDAELLEKLNMTRLKLVEPLLDFKKEAEDSLTIEAQARALMKYLNRINMEKSLLYRARELNEIGERSGAEENARLWQTICEATDTLVNVLGSLECDIETFRALLGVIFSETSIGRIPSFADEVTVGSADMLRLGGKRHIYLIGVNQGQFPMTVSDTSFFTDREKAALERLKLPIQPDTAIRNARELFCFSRAFASAIESVTLLYSMRTASFGASQPSDAIARIIHLSGKHIKPQRTREMPLLDRVYSAADALMMMGTAQKCERELLEEALEGYDNDGGITLCEGEVSNELMRLSPASCALYYGDEIYLSQSKLDSFMRCPFAYYLNHNLKLGECERAELNSSVIGSFIHAVLENFFEELRRRGVAISSLTEEERDALAEDSAKKYISSALGNGYGNARAQSAIKRLSLASRPVIDGLCHEFADCKFQPVFFELDTNGKEGDANPIVYLTRDGSKVIIGGTVDRVDTYKSGSDVYVRVIDYKSGAKEFSPEDLEEGANLQMFLYLKSIVETSSKSFHERIGLPEGGRMIPAGVIYV